MVVCGGGAKTPLVQKMVSDAFPHARLLNHIPPDEVIAMGAAKEVRLSFLSLLFLPNPFSIYSFLLSFPFFSLSSLLMSLSANASIEINRSFKVIFKFYFIYLFIYFFFFLRDFMF